MDGVYHWVIDAAAARFDADGGFLGYVGSVIDIDDRKEVEVALASSESRLQLAIEGARLGTWDWDLQAMQGSWSPRTMEILGVDEGECITSARRNETIHPEDRIRVWQEFAEAAKAGDELVSEYRIIRPDGEVRWIASRGALLRNAAGEPVSASGIVLDVTDRAIVEAKLRELNDSLEQRVNAALAERKVLADIIESTDATVQAIDHEFRFLAINPPAQANYEALFGVRPVVGQSLHEVLAHLPGEREAAERVWRRAIAGEAYDEVSWWGRDPASRRAFEMRFRPLNGPNGQSVGAYLFGTDITERLHEQEQLASAEAARREADALYRAYFENTAEALFVIAAHPDGRFTIEDLNPAHQEVTGLRLDEVRGRSIEAAFSADFAQSVLANYRRAIAADSALQYRESLEIDGVMTYWDTVIVPVRDASGRIVRLVGSSRDRTAQIAAEEQLRQSQKLEAMGTLVGGVAHDVNNLLSPIIGGLDLLHRRGVGDARAQRLIDGAMQSAERARLLVQRLLAFARRQPLQPVAVDLGELVTGMADLVASTSGPRVRVDVDVADGLPPVQADPNQLELAILNLSVNARDAMPDGGRLVISGALEAIKPGHRSKLPPGRYVRLSVSDTGTGMDEATAVRAIEPFFSTKGVGQGTGLGLSMAHGLASQLGGALAIRSKPGLGTTVEMWLPVATGLPAPEAGGEAPETTSAAGTVLVVDDEDLVRATTAEIVGDMGFTAVEADSAEAALRMIESGLTPRLVVTDHLMPGMSGTDLARTLRTRRPDLKVLIVSGYANVESIAPEFVLLPKPFRRSDLAAAVERLVPIAG